VQSHIDNAQEALLDNDIPKVIKELNSSDGELPQITQVPTEAEE
jgi:hypothetical protein